MLNNYKPYNPSPTPNLMMNNMGMNMNMGMGIGAGVPSSPRIGSSAMGPPGLPRSVSGDGMNINMNSAGGSVNSGAGGMNMIGMGGMNMNLPMNMSNISGLGMGMGMNAPTPRPQSSMGMHSGINSSSTSISGIGLSGTGPGMANNIMMNNMGMGMNMNIDSPSRGMMTGGGMPGSNLSAATPTNASATPQTSMRQGSLPPQTPTTPQQSQQHHHQQSHPTMSGPMSMQSIPMSMRQGAMQGGQAAQVPSSNSSRRQSHPPNSMGIGMNMGMGGNVASGNMGGMNMGGNIGMGGNMGNMGMSVGGMSTGSGIGIPMPGSPLVGAANLTMSGPMGGMGIPQPQGLQSHQGQGQVQQGFVAGGVLSNTNAMTNTNANMITSSMHTNMVGSSALAPGMLAAAPRSTTSPTDLNATSAFGSTSTSGPSSSSSTNSNSGTNTTGPPSSSSATNTGSHALPLLPPLNTNTTNITTVPLAASERLIRPLSPSEVEQIRGWMEVDRVYDVRLRSMKGRMAEEAWGAFRGVAAGMPGSGGEAGSTQSHLHTKEKPRFLNTAAAPNWWERGGLGSTGSNWNRFRRPGKEVFDVRYSGRRDLGGRSTIGGGYRSGRKGVKREGFRLYVIFYLVLFPFLFEKSDSFFKTSLTYSPTYRPKSIHLQEADKPEVLVPIRIEFDVEHHKMREAFVWNLNGTFCFFLRRRLYLFILFFALPHSPTQPFSFLFLIHFCLFEPRCLCFPSLCFYCVLTGSFGYLSLNRSDYNARNICSVSRRRLQPRTFVPRGDREEHPGSAK